MKVLSIVDSIQDPGKITINVSIIAREFSINIRKTKLITSINRLFKYLGTTVTVNRIIVEMYSYERRAMARNFHT